MDLIKIKKQILTIKLPIRIFAIFTIGLLAIGTMVFTYKASIDTFVFLFPALSLESNLLKIIAFSFGSLVAVATLVQSSSPIWNRMSYWGQCIDNKIINKFFKRKFFLDEADQYFNLSRKLLNHSNSEILQII